MLNIRRLVNARCLSLCLCGACADRAKDDETESHAWFKAQQYLHVHFHSVYVLLGCNKHETILLLLFQLGMPSFRADKIDQNRCVSNKKARFQKSPFRNPRLPEDFAFLRLQRGRYGRAGRLWRIGQQAAVASPLQPCSDARLKITCPRSFGRFCPTGHARLSPLSPLQFS